MVGEHNWLVVLLTSVSCPFTCLMGMVGRNWLQILAIMLELCLCQIGSYCAQDYACIIITSLLMHPLLWLRGHINPHWLSVRHWFGWHLTDCPNSGAHHGGRGEPGIHCLRTCYVELCGCVPLWRSKFVDVCNDAHGLLLSSRLVQLVCAVCVGWQCLPSLHLLSLAVLLWSRNWPLDLLTCWM